MIRVPRASTQSVVNITCSISVSFSLIHVRESRSCRVLTYTLGNPKSCDWGDICWGQFISQDGLHWQHNGVDPVLEPQLPYEDKGVFTGCMYPTGPHGEKDQLTLIYSSVNHLPIHWTIPYTRNCAGLALATSDDAGRTWHKSNLNPILNGEPEGLVVTGFRDPYLAEWPALDKARNKGEKRLYGIVSGGIVGKGPAAFLYEVVPSDLTTWTYIGPLADIPVGFHGPSHWEGDYGINWECVNFMTLSDGMEECSILTMGTEGGLDQRYHKDQENENDEVTSHRTWTLWMGVSVQELDGYPTTYDFGGILDNGDLYAPNSYKHPVTGEMIVWGWIKEEDLTLSRREHKGWAGYLSLPRELFLLRLPNVVRTLKSSLEDISSLKLVDDKASMGKSAYTLGIRPLSTLKSLRPQASIIWSSISTENNTPRLLATPRSANWELHNIIKVRQGLKRVGFYVRHDEMRSYTTTIYFAVDEEQIIVDKTSSNSEADIQKNVLTGPFTLFISEQEGTEVTEDLHLHIFSDGDVVEIFANDRFALSTTVYADAQTCLGISCFMEGESQSSGTFETIELWQGLQNINSTVKSMI